MERKYDNEVHYWVVLLDDGKYKELYGTYDHVLEYMSAYDQHYRLILWED